MSSSATRRRVLLIHHTAAPAMLPVLRHIAAAPDIDLHVLFASKIPPHRQWSVAPMAGVSHRVLPEFSINLGRAGAPFVLRLNPTAALEIVRHRPDLVISTPFPALASLAALLTCRLRRRPFILDLYTMASASRVRQRLAPVLGRLAGTCAGFVAKSTRTVEYLLELGVPRERIFLAYHAVDVADLAARSRLEPAERARVRTRYGIDQERVVLYVGRLVERKGLAYLLRAVQQLKPRLPSTALVIVGDGYQRPALEGLCAREGIADVHFTGPVPHEEVPRLYGLAHMLVLPSVSTRVKFWGEETWGFVVAEAMACGLPVVVTDRVGGSDDMVREGVNGHVVPEKSAERLCRAMLDVLRDERRRAAMGEASREIVQRFSAERAAEGYLAAIRSALGTPVATREAPGHRAEPGGVERDGGH